MLPQRAVIVPPPTILKSDEDGNYEVVDSIKNILPRYENVGVFSNRNMVTPRYKNLIKHKNQVIVFRKERPKYVPNSIRNYYAEFP